MHRLEVHLDATNAPGRIGLPMLASLARSLQGAVNEVVGVELAYPGGRPGADAKELSKLDLAGIKEGSTILVCTPASPEDGVADTVLFATAQLVQAVQAFSETGQWARSIPRQAAAFLAKFKSVLGASGIASLVVEDRGGRHRCDLDAQLCESLAVANRDADASIGVEIVGKLYELNDENHTIRINTGRLKPIIELDEQGFRHAQELLWKRLFVAAHPHPDKQRTFSRVLEIRQAEPLENNGVSDRATRHSDRAVPSRRLDAIRELKPGWDGYRGVPPSPALISFVEGFLGGVALLADHHGVSKEIAAPAVVPIGDGSLQAEWEAEGRGLELEFRMANRFQYVREDATGVVEGQADRHKAIELIRWVLTGSERWTN